MKKIGAANKVYLAYGSNLNLEQMRHRCPYAIPLWPVELSGYRLLFRGGNGNAVATVEPKEGGSVPALLWEITPRDEEALDRYEGWPHLYRKETVKVAAGRKMVEAMVYVMNGGHPLGLPGEYYLGVIIAGYTSAGFDPQVLKQAMRDSAEQECGTQGDCLACSNAFSEEGERDGDPDRLFCMEQQKYVGEDDFCDQFN
jgi:gamma-glutamylcyclotransferase (GGCT)/AIG2-like uncharacterized protein YtfP